MDDEQRTGTGSPLDGILVADFSRVLAGPLATMFLGDLGADVIKVEHPGGDDTRTWGPPWADDGTATYYESVNRNKRSIRLDLKEQTDLDLARELARRADVLVENLRPGGMGRLGLGYETVSASNTGIVYVSITGFGEDSELPGYDLLVQATSGLMSIGGPPEGPSFKTGVAIVDVVSGLHTTIGVLAALVERSKSGRGQRLRINLMQSALSSLVNQASGYLGAGVVPGRLGNAHPSIAPYEAFRAADGEFIIAVGNDRQFRALCGALERPAVADDDRFATNAARVEHREVLHAVIEDVTRTRPAAAWMARLAAASVPCGSINRIDAAFEMAGHLGLEPVTSIEGFDTVRSPLDLSRTPVRYRLPPPGLGVHDETVRAWLSA